MDSKTLTPLPRPSGFKTMWVWLVVLAAIWGIQLFVSDQIDPYILIIIMQAGINITLASSLNLVNGFTGQFSMGHAGFMAVGGYASAYTSISIASSHPGIFETPVGILIFLGLLLLGGLAAAVMGYVVGQPSLRLRGDYLAIVTLGFGEIIRVLILNIDAIGGPRGLTDIPGLANFGWVFTFALITVFTVWRLVTSDYGRDFLAVREDEIAAEAMGVNTTRIKVRAFVISSFFAGIAGALFAHFLRNLNPATFDFNRSFEIIIMVVLGGMGSVTGSVVAAVMLTVIREALRPLQEFTGLDFRMVIYALFLIVLMLTRPNGLLGTRELRDFLPSRRKAAKEGVAS